MIAVVGVIELCCDAGEYLWKTMGIYFKISWI
jgi:hypothetical protein